MPRNSWFVLLDQGLTGLTSHAVDHDLSSLTDPPTTHTAALRARRGTQQAGRELLRGLSDSGLGDARGIGGIRSGDRVLRCIGGEPNELLGDLELAVLVTQAFGFEPEHGAGLLAKLLADGAPRSGRNPVSDGSARHRQRLLCRALEHSAELLAHRRAHELADRAGGLLDEPAEEVVQLGLL